MLLGQCPVCSLRLQEQVDRDARAGEKHLPADVLQNTSHHCPGEQRKLIVVLTVTNVVFQCCRGVRVQSGRGQHSADALPLVWSVVASSPDAVRVRPHAGGERGRERGGWLQQAVCGEQPFQVGSLGTGQTWWTPARRPS